MAADRQYKCSQQFVETRLGNLFKGERFEVQATATWLSWTESRLIPQCTEADTLDGGDLAQRSEFLRRKAANHAPLPFELVQLGDEAEDLGCDAENGGQHGCLG